MIKPSGHNCGLWPTTENRPTTQGAPLKRIGLALIFSLHFTTAYSQTFAARGVGTYTCAEFAQQYKENPQGVETLYFSWAQGFMSGQNFGAKAMKDLGGDIQTQMGILRMYCAENPLKSFLQAVVDMYAKRKPLP